MCVQVETRSYESALLAVSVASVINSKVWFSGCTPRFIHGHTALLIGVPEEVLFFFLFSSRSNYSNEEHCCLTRMGHT